MFGQNDDKKDDDNVVDANASDFGIASDTPPVPPVTDDVAVTPTVEPTVDTPAADTSTVSDAPATSGNNDHLLDLKQDALKDLMPLLGQLDQTTEEKFKTTMMMIQATDNADLIKDAYESAKAITSEKVRAQALLDVVNEINYFTHKNESK